MRRKKRKPEFKIRKRRGTQQSRWNWGRKEYEKALKRPNLTGIEKETVEEYLARGGVIKKITSYQALAEKWLNEKLHGNIKEVRKLFETDMGN